MRFLPALFAGAVLGWAAACLVEPTCDPPEAVMPVGPPDLGTGLDGFDSPYLGHTGSWDGAGGEQGGTPKDQQLDLEADMGLRWTFMPVYWSVLEKDGPTSPGHDPHGAWHRLDTFVAKARRRGLNVLMQVVVGGNAGGPPNWAGRRVQFSSAPEDMDGLVDFSGKLVRRYMPGGTLSREKGWTDGYGIRAWELDNEPGTYQTNWSKTADDYAEFVTKAAARIKEQDGRAVVLTTASASGDGDMEFLEQVLDADIQSASPLHRAVGHRFSVGPATDVVSFHDYELMDALSPRRGLECAFRGVKERFERYAQQERFTYRPPQLYWHTEGGYDFALPGLGAYRGKWVIQWFARAFSMGIRKVAVMDANNDPQLQQAVSTMVRLLPNPFPLERVTDQDRTHVYRWTGPTTRIFIAWAKNGSLVAERVHLPVLSTRVTRVDWDGSESSLDVRDGEVTLSLPGGRPFAAPVFVVDGP